MNISKLLEDASSQLEETSRFIELSRTKRQYARAIAAIANAHDESIQEKVHRLAGHVHPASVARSAVTQAPDSNGPQLRSVPRTR